jgi:hypothetical protein
LLSCTSFVHPLPSFLHLSFVRLPCQHAITIYSPSCHHYLPSLMTLNCTRQPVYCYRGIRQVLQLHVLREQRGVCRQDGAKGNTAQVQG